MFLDSHYMFIRCRKIALFPKLFITLHSKTNNKSTKHIMKKLIYIFIPALLLAGVAPMQAQTKAKAKTQTQAKAKSQKTTTKTSTKTTQAATPKTLYVEPEVRNYAQNLGGYMFWDYTHRESRGTLTKCLLSKEEKKELLAKYSYSTYEEAFNNLLEMPAASDVDTREKLTYYIDYVLNPRIEATKQYEPEPQLKEESDKLNKARMEIAKRARKGLPFDTIYVDKKWPEYNKVLDKIKAANNPLYSLFTDVVTLFDTKDPDLKSWLADTGGGAPRFYFNNYSPLVKQMVKEWFASDECKQVQAIEDQLRARAEAEQPKKTPDWFVEGRKREGEIIARYNRKLAERWIQKTPTSTLNACKTALTKLMAYNKEIEAIRGNDKFTYEYLAARISNKGCIETLFNSYFSLLDLSRMPLVRTPDTQEGAKKFKLEESPWKLSYPYSSRK